MTLEITVETLTGSDYRLRVRPDDTTLSLKSRLRRLRGVPVSQQRLLLSGTELEDAQSLAAGGVTHGCRLRLVLAVRSGPLGTAAAAAAAAAAVGLRRHKRLLQRHEQERLLWAGEQLAQWRQCSSSGSGGGDGRRRAARGSSHSRQVALLVFRDGGGRLGLQRVVLNGSSSGSSSSTSTSSGVGDSDRRRRRWINHQYFRQLLQNHSVHRRHAERGSAGRSSRASELRRRWQSSDSVRPPSSPAAETASDGISESPALVTSPLSASLCQSPSTSAAVIADAANEPEDSPKCAAVEDCEMVVPAPPPVPALASPQPDIGETAVMSPGALATSSLIVNSTALPLPVNAASNKNNNSSSNDSSHFMSSMVSCPGFVGASSLRCALPALMQPTHSLSTPPSLTLPAAVTTSTGSSGGGGVGGTPRDSVRRRRCAVCRRRLTLAELYRCSCVDDDHTVFCGQHRYPETHACPRDLKAEGRALMIASNPLVVADKLPKI